MGAHTRLLRLHCRADFGGRAGRTTFGAGNRSLSSTECTVNSNTQKGTALESEQTGRWHL